MKMQHYLDVHLHLYHVPVFEYCYSEAGVGPTIIVAAASQELHIVQFFLCVLLG